MIPDGMTPLEYARQREKENILNSCHECKNCVKVGGAWYCEDSGKLIHPYKLERISPLRCERAIRKEVT